MKAERRTAARQASIDRARDWRARRDRLSVSTFTLGECAGFENPSRFEAVLCSKLTPTDEECAAIEATLAALEGGPCA
jgi:hypothetical protein